MLFMRVTLTLAHFSPTRPAATRRGLHQAPAAGPHTGRGARMVGLVDGRTRDLN